MNSFFQTRKLIVAVSVCLLIFENAYALKTMPSKWSSFIGGAGGREGIAGHLPEETANAVISDSSGYIYIAGKTNSSQIAGHDSNSLFGGGPSDAFVAKLSRNGQDIIWFTYIGGEGSEEAHGLVIDENSACLYVSGYTDTSARDWPYNSSDDIGPHGAFDIFISKIASDSGTQQWIVRIGGSDNDYCSDMIFSPGTQPSDSCLYLAGATSSTDFPAMLQNSCTSGVQNALICRFFPDAAIPYLDVSRGTGGAYHEEIQGITQDRSNNIWVVSNSFQMQNNERIWSSHNIRVLYFEPDLISEWSSPVAINGNDLDYAFDIKVLSSEPDDPEIIIAGFSGSSDWISRSDPYDHTYRAFVASMTNCGISWCYTLDNTANGTDYHAYGYAVDVDSKGYIHFCGSRFVPQSIQLEGFHLLLNPPVGNSNPTLCHATFLNRGDSRVNSSARAMFLMPLNENFIDDGKSLSVVLAGEGNRYFPTTNRCYRPYAGDDNGGMYDVFAAKFSDFGDSDWTPVPGILWEEQPNDNGTPFIPIGFNFTQVKQTDGNTVVNCPGDGCGTCYPLLVDIVDGYDEVFQNFLAPNNFNMISIFIDPDQLIEGQNDPYCTRLVELIRKAASYNLYVSLSCIGYPDYLVPEYRYKYRFWVNRIIDEKNKFPDMRWGTNWNYLFMDKDDTISDETSDIHPLVRDNLGGIDAAEIFWTDILSKLVAINDDFNQNMNDGIFVNLQDRIVLDLFTEPGLATNTNPYSDFPVTYPSRPFSMISGTVVLALNDVDMLVVKPNWPNNTKRYDLSDSAARRDLARDIMIRWTNRLILSLKSNSQYRTIPMGMNIVTMKNWVDSDRFDFSMEWEASKDSSSHPTPFSFETIEHSFVDYLGCNMNMGMFPLNMPYNKRFDSYSTRAVSSLRDIPNGKPRTVGEFSWGMWHPEENNACAEYYCYADDLFDAARDVMELQARMYNDYNFRGFLYCAWDMFASFKHDADYQYLNTSIDVMEGEPPDTGPSSELKPVLHALSPIYRSLDEIPEEERMPLRSWFFPGVGDFPSRENIGDLFLIVENSSSDDVPMVLHIFPGQDMTTTTLINSPSSQHHFIAGENTVTINFNTLLGQHNRQYYGFRLDATGPGETVLNNLNAYFKTSYNGEEEFRYFKEICTSVTWENEDLGDGKQRSINILLPSTAIRGNATIQLTIVDAFQNTFEKCWSLHPKTAYSFPLESIFPSLSGIVNITLESKDMLPENEGIPMVAELVSLPATSQNPDDILFEKDTNCSDISCEEGATSSCCQGASVWSVFSDDKQIPGFGNDRLPCVNSENNIGRWLEISVPPKCTLTVRANECNPPGLGIGFYDSGGSHLIHGTFGESNNDISLDYINTQCNFVSIKILVNSRSDANHPTITFTCELDPHCSDGSCISSPKIASCSSVFSYENQIPGTGSDTLPCYGGSGLRSRWLEISVPAETKLTVQVNETDTCILGIGFYSACGNLANPLAQICGYEDISLSYENSASSPVTLKVLVNDHPAANHPTITFTCTPVSPGETCSSAKPAACGDQFGPDWFGPPYQTIAESTDIAPCATASELVGHWLKITAQPGQSVTVSVEDVDLNYHMAVAFYEECPPASPISCAACPAEYSCDPVSLTYQNTSGAPKELYVLVNRHSGSCGWAITVSCTQSTKDECAGAEPITCGTTLQGQLLLNATASTPNACRSGVPDVWYYVDVPLCGTGINAYYEAGGQAFVSIYTGTDCNNLVERMCSATQYDYRKYYACYPTEENNVRVYIRIGTTDTSGTQKLTLSCFDKLDSMSGCQR